MKSQTQVTSADNCNCRNKEACPLQNKCMNKDIVYKATISTSNANDTKHYIGMTSSTFKERYRNHIKSFTHKKYSNETELSKHICRAVARTLIGGGGGVYSYIQDLPD